MKNQGLKLLVGILVTPFAVIVHGYVLTLIWKMFIVSTFNLPSLSLVQAAGLMLVIDFIFLKMDLDDKFENLTLGDYISKLIAHSLVTPFVMLGTGYILSLFL